MDPAQLEGGRGMIHMCYCTVIQDGVREWSESSGLFCEMTVVISRTHQLMS